MERSLGGFSPGLIFGTVGAPIVPLFFVIVPNFFGGSLNISGSICGMVLALGAVLDLLGFSKVAVEGRGRSTFEFFGVIVRVPLIGPSGDPPSPASLTSKVKLASSGAIRGVEDWWGRRGVEVGMGEIVASIAGTRALAGVPRLK